jgi:hypothetical protein
VPRDPREYCSICIGLIVFFADHRIWGRQRGDKELTGLRGKDLSRVVALVRLRGFKEVP